VAGEIWHDQGARGSAWPHEISRQSVQGWERGSQNIKNFHFLVVASQGRTPGPISKIFTGFYTPDYPTLAFQIWRDSLSHCWETARQSFRPNFSVHAVGKTMRWTIEKWLEPFLMVSTSYITMQSLGEDRTTRADCSSKIWCLYFFCLSRSEAGALFVRRGLSEQLLCHGLWVDFDAVFTFFGSHCPFRWTR